MVSREAFVIKPGHQVNYLTHFCYVVAYVVDIFLVLEALLA